MLKETLVTMSTAHLTDETFNSISKSKTTYLWGLGIYPFDYGWFFYIGDDEFDLDEMPEDLAILVERARKENADWLLLDQDVPTEDDLPVYD